MGSGRQGIVQPTGTICVGIQWRGSVAHPNWLMAELLNSSG